MVEPANGSSSTPRKRWNEETDPQVREQRRLETLDQGRTAMGGYLGLRAQNYMGAGGGGGTDLGGGWGGHVDLFHPASPYMGVARANGVLAQFGIAPVQLMGGGYGGFDAALRGAVEENPVEAALSGGPYAAYAALLKGADWVRMIQEYYADKTDRDEKNNKDKRTQLANQGNTPQGLGEGYAQGTDGDDDESQGPNFLSTILNLFAVGSQSQGSNEVNSSDQYSGGTNASVIVRIMQRAGLI